VAYYDPRGPWQMSMYPGVRRLLPAPYAQFELDAGGGAGRWVASPIDLAWLLSRVSGLRAPAFLQPETFALLLERPNPFVPEDEAGLWWYAMGISVTSVPQGLVWMHDGS